MTKYIQVTLLTDTDKEEELTMLMFGCGAQGVAVDDPSIIKEHLLAKKWDASVFDDKNIVTGRITLSCTLENTPEGREIARNIAHGASQVPHTFYNCQELPDMDWLAKWKEGFDPRPIGSRFWLVPVWEQAPAPAGRLPLVVEPGLSFGTGDHATTAMALDMLAAYHHPGATLADLGCGSGILAIAGKLLGGGATVAVDIDPVCEEAVAHHCRMNNIDPEDISYYTGDILRDEAVRKQVLSRHYHLVTANINAAIVRTLIPAAHELLQPDGVFICSGIVDMFGSEIESAFAASPLKIIEKREEKGWLAYAARLEK